MSQKFYQNAKEIGARFRSARSLVSNNRKIFCEQHDINRYTMQSWENGLHVSKNKNVEKFVHALLKEGVYCSSDWLIDGIGEPPRQFSTQTDNVGEEDQSTDICESIISYYENIGVCWKKLLVKDDTMVPAFKEGDIVFGIKEENILTNYNYIIELSESSLLARRVIINKDDLILTTFDDRSYPLVVSNKVNAYKIVWHFVST